MRNEFHRLHQPIAAARVDWRIGDLDDLHVRCGWVEVDGAHSTTPHAGRPECEAKEDDGDKARERPHAFTTSGVKSLCASDLTESSRLTLPCVEPLLPPCSVFRTGELRCQIACHATLKNVPNTLSGTVKCLSQWASFPSLCQSRFLKWDATVARSQSTTGIAKSVARLSRSRPARNTKQLSLHGASTDQPFQTPASGLLSARQCSNDASQSFGKSGSRVNAAASGFCSDRRLGLRSCSRRTN